VGIMGKNAVTFTISTFEGGKVNGKVFPILSIIGIFIKIKEAHNEHIQSN